MKLIPVDELIRLYQEGWSTKELAIRYKVSDGTITKRLKDSNVSVRGHSEAMKHIRTRDAIREKRIGVTAWNKGLTMNTDHRVHQFALSLRGKKKPEGFGEQMSKARRKNILYTHCQVCGKEKGHNNSTRCTLCAAKYRAENFPNPMKGRKMTDEHWKKMMKNQGWGKMTRPEKRVKEIIEWMYHPFSVYRYNGTGGFSLKLPSGKRKIPDFVHMSQKKVIEVFGRYWHKEEEASVLIEAYSSIGWDCLIIWEEETLTCLFDTIMHFTDPFEYDDYIGRGAII